MGYCHVNRIFKGIELKLIDLENLINTIPDSWLPDEKWLVEKYPEIRGCGYTDMKKEVKLVFLGCLKRMPRFFGMPKSAKDITEEIAMELYSEYYCRICVLLPSLALIYCYVNEYPIDAFECFIDYNDTWMFVCSTYFPPKEYHEKLAKLTESVLEKELSEFLTVVAGYEYKAKLEICEEYIKE